VISQIGESMKIYFAGSIRAGREDRELYADLIQHLMQYGDVLTEHVGSKDIKLNGEDGLTDEQIFNRDIGWVKESDVIVAEVTTPSLGVGLELGKADEWGKPVLCLYRKQDGKRLSAMVAGDKKLTVRVYSSPQEAKRIIDLFFGSL